MSNIESFKKSLELEELYSQFRLIKAWGIMILCLGTLIVLDKTTYLLSQIFHFSIQEMTQFFDLYYFINNILYPIIIISAFIFLPSLTLIYTFFSVKTTKIRNNQISYQRTTQFAGVLLIFYPSSFFIPFIFSIFSFNTSTITLTDVFGQVSIELASFAFSCLLSVYLLNKIVIEYRFKELRNLGLFFLLLSFLIFIYHFFLVFLDLGWIIIDLINIPSTLLNQFVNNLPDPINPLVYGSFRIILSIFYIPILLNCIYLLILLSSFLLCGITTIRNANQSLKHKITLFDEENDLIKGTVVKTDLIFPENQNFSSSVRFTIMMILIVHTTATFSELQNLLKLTPGRVDYNINQLVNEELILRKKAFVSQRALTVVKITEKGITSFKNHTAQIQSIINRIS